MIYIYIHTYYIIWCLFQHGEKWRVYLCWLRKSNLASYVRPNFGYDSSETHLASESLVDLGGSSHASVSGGSLVTQKVPNCSFRDLIPLTKPSLAARTSWGIHGMRHQVPTRNGIWRKIIGKYGGVMGFYRIYPLVNVCITMERSTMFIQKLTNFRLVHFWQQTVTLW